MKMKRTIYAARLRAILSVMAALLVVFAGVAAASSAAWAAEPLAPGEYYQNRLEGVEDKPGFEWVDKSAEGNTRGTGYYRIYNAFPNNPNSHEAASGWYYFAQASREHTFDGYLVVLDSDIDFSGVDWGRVNNDTHAYTVGSEDQRFSGTFDGNGHTLSNFTNERDGLQLQMDNGFFGWVNDATIKNINFKDCYVGSTYRGGLVAGYAQDTFFLNILAEDCTTSIVPANNVLNLITNAGISGGTIAGVANGCALYNCEMRSGRVVTNSTAGVAALGGQPLYMGGLVGQANDAIIEYCRVTDKWVEGDDGAKTPHIRRGKRYLRDGGLGGQLLRGLRGRHRGLHAERGHGLQDHRLLLHGGRLRQGGHLLRRGARPGREPRLPRRHRGHRARRRRRREPHPARELRRQSPLLPVQHRAAGHPHHRDR